MEMKRRGADRVVGIDFDDDYLAQARFAATVEGLDIEFRQMSVYDVAAAGRAVRRRVLHRRIISLAPPVAGAGPDPPSTSRGTCWCSSPCSAAARTCRRSLRIILSRTRRRSTRRDTRSCISSSTAIRTTTPTGGRPTARVRPRCCAVPGSGSRRCRRRRCSSAATWRAPVRPLPYPARGDRPSVIEAAMIWNEPNNKSHWDLEADPGWVIFAETCTRLAGQAIACRKRRVCRACSAGFPRSTRTSSACWPTRVCWRSWTRWPCTAFRSTGTTGLHRRMAGQDRHHPGGDGPTGVGVRSWHFHVRRAGGAGMGPAPHRRIAARPGAPHPLVQPIRPAGRVARNDAPSGGRRIILLPSFSHGPV